MLATPKSYRPPPQARKTLSGPPAPPLFLVLAFFALASFAQPGTSSHYAYAERVYRQARLEQQHSPDNPTAAWQFARACSSLAELTETDAQRETLAQEGIETCRQTIQHHPNLAPAHYYLAMNLGQLARSKGLSALKIIREMEEAFQTVIKLDPSFDYAGPHRTLGILYRDTPGWPTSIGSRKKAREHMEKALNLCPDYPGNHIVYLTTLLEWGEKDTVQKKLPATENVLQAARSKLTGDLWALSWEEWQQSWQTIKAKISPLAQPTAVESR
jgi:tetratricopeptide (TPR) repeat protein